MSLTYPTAALINIANKRPPDFVIGGAEQPRQHRPGLWRQPKTCEMTPQTSADQRNVTTAKQMAAVRLVLQRSKTPLMAKDIAALAALDVRTTSDMLVRLRGLRQARDAGRLKTMILWAKDSPQKASKQQQANTPHLPSTQPNGSVKFWSAWTQTMNTPARLELQK